LVPGEFDKVADAVGGEGLLEQGTGSRPQLVPTADGSVALGERAP